MVVGAASLAVVVYQAQLQRDQNELERRAHAASVLPYLMVVTSINDQGVFMNLRNAGIGPARIDGVRVLHRGGANPGDAVDFYSRMRSNPDMPTDIDQLKPGRLVAAGEWVRMLGTGNSAARTQMTVELLRLFEIAELPRNMYEDYDRRLAAQAKAPASQAEPAARQPGMQAAIFGEQWILRSDDIIPKPVNGPPATTNRRP